MDLLLPKVGKGARATNYDYTKGKLAQLIDVIIEEKVKLFTCAVGVPPKWAVDKLHAAGIVCMNMVGAPHHVEKVSRVMSSVCCVLLCMMCAVCVCVCCCAASTIALSVASRPSSRPWKWAWI